MILTSSPPAVSSSSSAPTLTGPLLFQRCVGSQGSHVLEIIHPRAASRRRPETVKLYTESLWAAGRALMKDSETVGRITNARLRHTHTHTYLQRRNAGKHTHTLSRYSPDSKARWESERAGGGRERLERWVARIDGWVVLHWMDEEI